MFDLTALPDSLTPGDEGYDAAARVLFATGRPAMVLRPATRAEVADAVVFARGRDLPIAVRGGGHGLLGHGTSNGGCVIDLSRLDRVEVLDADRRLVRIGGGATWGRVDAALRPLGWAISSGDTAGVGVGGLTLGGGVGAMVRQHGLAIDALVAARVVLADGSTVTASSAQHADLFWALRGGGGNFGVVVDFDFVAAEVPVVHVGEIDYRGDPSALLHRWRVAMRAAPLVLSSALVIPPSEVETPLSATVTFCVTGCDVPEADSAIEPLLELGAVSRATIEERAYGEVLSPGVPLPPGRQLVARNTLVSCLDADVQCAIEDFRDASPLSTVIVRSLGGRFGEVRPGATAFAHRDAEAMVLAMSLVPEGDVAAEAAVDLAWSSVAAHGSGIYLNFQGRSTSEDLAAAYPPATYARLVEVKRKYDPENVFRRNHNVAPEDSNSPTQ